MIPDYSCREGVWFVMVSKYCSFLFKKLEMSFHEPLRTIVFCRSGFDIFVGFEEVLLLGNVVVISALAFKFCRHWLRRIFIRKRLNAFLLWMRENDLTIACLKLRNQQMKRWKHIIWRRDEKRILWLSLWVEGIVTRIAHALFTCSKK